MQDERAQADFFDFISKDWRRWFAWWNMIMEDRIHPSEAEVEQHLPVISEHEWDTLTLEALELRIVQDRVQRTGNKMVAAATLGISRSTMYRILDRAVAMK